MAWGNVAHVVVTDHHVQMCIQINTAMVANAHWRDGINQQIARKNPGASLADGACPSNFSNGTYHKGDVSVWVA